MFSFFHQRMFLQILCVMILFGSNTLFALLLKPVLEPVPKQSKKYLGVTLSQNFAFRNYTENYLFYPYDLRNFGNEFQPSISFGIHLEQNLSNQPNSASLKFKLLYEQFNSHLRNTSYFYDISTRDVIDSLMFNNTHSITQYSLQTAFVQRLFSTNLSFLLGGTVAFVQNDVNKEFYELNSIKDTALFTSNGPSPYYSFTEDYSRYMIKDYDRAPDARFTLNLGLQYDFKLENVKVVPFVLYNHDFNSRHEDYSLYSFQTGIDISFPIR